MTKSDIQRLIKRRKSILLNIEDRRNIKMYSNRITIQNRRNIKMYSDRITIENPTDEQIRKVLNGIISLPNYKKEMKKELLDFVRL